MIEKGYYNIKRKKIVVTFNSGITYYDKEKSGVKNNTVREIDFKDERFKKLRYWREAEDKHYFSGVGQKATHIIIENRHHGVSFEREIKDVTFYKNLCIITWRHEKKS